MLSLFERQINVKEVRNGARRIFFHMVYFVIALLVNPETPNISMGKTDGSSGRVEPLNGLYDHKSMTFSPFTVTLQ